MKGIKNSLKKLSFTRLSVGESTHSNLTEFPELESELESKRSNYRECVAKIAKHGNFEFPEDAIHPRILDAIEDLEIREDDIFMFSYPASNGHLLEDMVRLLVNRDAQNRSEILHGRVKSDSIPVGRLEAANLYGHLRWLKSLKAPRLLASHLPFDLLPKQLHSPMAKIIYLARNPKDHIVAYYYHHRLKGIQISLDDFIDLYLNGYLLYGSYFDHVVSFWQLAKLHPSNVLFISYEELKIVPYQMARLIVDFLDLNLTDEELEEVLSQKHSKIENKNLDEIKEEPETSEINRNRSLKIGKFQGVLGDWINYFNPEQTRKLDYMIRLKFESQQLLLLDDASLAMKRINRFGRLVVHDIEDKRRRYNRNVGNDRSVRSYTALQPNDIIDNGGTWTQTMKSKFRKKPIFTKDEAAFIRKKDKVVILDDRYQPSDGNDHAHSEDRWIIRFYDSASITFRLRG
ncbi:Sulfotransferase cytosolic 1B member 1-like [Blomia tropicalis]|nr:Sulfotransferase cytosolic 1B member 1-like [Blomia tropicalis]